MTNSNTPKNVSKVTARLLGYKTPADVPFQIKGPHGTPVARKLTIKGSGKVRVV